MSNLSDATINQLILEPKTLPEGLTAAPKLSSRNKHKRKEYEVTSHSGNQFVVFLRQSELNPVDFSAILGYRIPHSYAVFRLRRYNGKHQHTNVIEKETLLDYHIHTATERYQAVGFREDAFAETTNRYSTLGTAINCLIEDCGFNPFEGTPMFGGAE